MFNRKGFVFFVFLLLLVGMSGNSFSTTLPIEGIPYSVVVIDSAQETPLQLARVSLRKNGALVAGKITDPTGRVTFPDIKPGWYIISVQLVDYVSYSDSIFIDKTNSTKTVYLREVIHEELTVTGDHEQNITTIDPKTGAQVFEAETYHPSPIARMTNLIQENMIGAAKAPTGEVHIRGQHGEYMYYVDGIPIPLGVFGGLNEVVDSKVIERATFLTGGFPAEYGGQMAAVIDVQNRVPGGKAHLDLSTYAGSYLGRDNNSPDSLGIHSQKLRPINVNGQALAFSDHLGKLGIFLSGSRQETDRRIDSPLPFIYHDHGFDYFLYGKFDYLASDNDYLTMNLNFGRTLTEIPYDPIEEGAKDDYQRTTNAFQTLSLFHTVSREADKESNIFIGLYAREGGLIFSPGAIDVHNFRFSSDTSKGYVLAEDRGFTTVGTRAKWDMRFSHEFMITAGLNLSATRGKEDFTSTDSNGKAGPVFVTDYSGSDFGLFAQSEIHPAEWTRIDVGLRYDQHIAPDAPVEKQISPRLKWNIFFDENATAYLYYGRLFMPNNIEGLRTISSSVGGNTAVPTLAESADMYEAALLYNFDIGLRSKLAFFRKIAVPGVDDQTVGSSAVKTPVNISKVVTNGVELGLSYSDPSTYFSGYANCSLVHAYGSGMITGGFLAFQNAGIVTDLDHDQRLSVVFGLKYQPQDWFIDVTPMYSSGLTNGNSTFEYSPGLFDFNQGAHTTPSWVINLSAGYTFHLTGAYSLELSMYINNLLDNDHLIKGAYFSGAAWEDPRNLVVNLTAHI